MACVSTALVIWLLWHLGRSTAWPFRLQACSCLLTAVLVSTCSIMLEGRVHLQPCHTLCHTQCPRQFCLSLKTDILQLATTCCHDSKARMTAKPMHTSRHSMHDSKASNLKTAGKARMAEGKAGTTAGQACMPAGMTAGTACMIAKQARQQAKHAQQQAKHA